jgi:hypothetical protein
MSSLWMGIATAAHGAVRRGKAHDRGAHVLSILAGVLLALLIGVVLFVVAAFS